PYGFRPGRNQHQALDALSYALLRMKVNYVLDADIRGFFDNLDKSWLIKFVEHRVADPRILRLIQKWLNAGVMEEGKWSETKTGTPQGSVITPLTQLLNRQECFLVGVEKSFHAFANMRQLSLQTLLTFLSRIAGARDFQPTVQFLLDQRRVFQQSDHLRPDDLIEEILSDKAAVVANRTTQFAPAIGANTFVIVDLARARARRYARKGVAALLTADQPLHHTRLDGATARSYFVVLEKLLCTSEAVLADQGGHGDLDPLLRRTSVPGGLAV